MSTSEIEILNNIHQNKKGFEIGEDAEKINMGDRVKVNIRTGEIENLTTGEKIQAKPFPGFIMDILEAGGIRGKILSRKSEYQLLR